MKKKLELPKGNIILLESTHQYLNMETGKTFTGITKMIKDYLFPDMYSSVPEKILKMAAERGTLIHKQISEYITKGVKPTDPDAMMYESAGVNAIASEYIVSDGVSYASAIDIISEDLSLIDIKTVQKIDTEYKKYTSWELSIQAYMLYKSTGIMAKSLKILHLRDQNAILIDIDMIPFDKVEAFMSDPSGFKDDSSVPSLTEDNVKLITETSKAILEIVNKKKEMDDQEEKLKKGLLELFRKSGTYKFENDIITITRVPESETSRFDSKKFKKDHEKLYEEYMTKSKKNEYILINTKK